METAREDANQKAYMRVYVNADEYSGGYGTGKLDTYLPSQTDDENIRRFGHGGSDYWSMYHFVEKIRGNKDADIIDVYEALDMFFPGLLAYRSVLNGGAPVEVPDFRDKTVREKYRNDTACTDPKVAGDQLIPVYSKGNPEIDPAVYEHMKNKWLAEFEADEGYTKAAFRQSGKAEEEKK
jgi:hypothetical protein